MRGRECVPAVVGPRCRSCHVTAMCCHDKSGMPESLSLSPSRVITSRRFHREPVAGYTSSCKPPCPLFSFSGATVARYSLLPRHSHRTCRGEYYRDGEQELRSDIFLNHKDVRKFWYKRRDASIFTRPESDVILPANEATSSATASCCNWEDCLVRVPQSC